MYTIPWTRDTSSWAKIMLYISSRMERRVLKMYLFHLRKLQANFELQAKFHVSPKCLAFQPFLINLFTNTWSWVLLCECNDLRYLALRSPGCSTEEWIVVVSVLQVWLIFKLSNLVIYLLNVQTKYLDSQSKKKEIHSKRRTGTLSPSDFMKEFGW